MNQLKLTPKEWQKLKKITTSEIAEALGVHINTVFRWFSTPAKMSISDAFKLADLFGISIDEIIFFDEDTTYVVRN